MESLENLEIIGYANVLGPDSVPHIVAPIFRLRETPDVLLFPPFRLAGTVVLGETRGSLRDMDSFATTGRATRLQEAIPARADHELWIDQQMQPHYDPAVEADATLRRIALDAVKEARAALKQPNLHEAERLCGVAVAADDRLPEPLILMAAIYTLREEFRRVGAMRIVARLHCTDEGFTTGVNAVLGSLEPPARSDKYAGLGRAKPVSCQLGHAIAA